MAKPAQFAPFVIQKWQKNEDGSMYIFVANGEVKTKFYVDNTKNYLWNTSDSGIKFILMPIYEDNSFIQLPKNSYTMSVNEKGETIATFWGKIFNTLQSYDGAKLKIRIKPGQKKKENEIENVLNFGVGGAKLQKTSFGDCYTQTTNGIKFILMG